MNKVRIKTGEIWYGRSEVLRHWHWTPPPPWQKTIKHEEAQKSASSLFGWIAFGLGWTLLFWPFPYADRPSWTLLNLWATSNLLKAGIQPPLRKITLNSTNTSPSQGGERRCYHPAARWERAIGWLSGHIGSSTPENAWEHQGTPHKRERHISWPRCDMGLRMPQSWSTPETTFRV